jgi:hypothetical protein
MLQVHLQIEEQIGDDRGHLEGEAHHQMAMKIPVAAAAVAAAAAAEEGLETPAADAPARIEVLAAATVVEIEQLLVVAVVAAAVVVAHSAALGRCDEPQVQEEISLTEEEEEEELRQLHLHH